MKRVCSDCGTIRVRRFRSRCSPCAETMRIAKRSPLPHAEKFASGINAMHNGPIAACRTDHGAKDDDYLHRVVAEHFGIEGAL